MLIDRARFRVFCTLDGLALCDVCFALVVYQSFDFAPRRPARMWQMLAIDGPALEEAESCMTFFGGL